MAGVALYQALTGDGCGGPVRCTAWPPERPPPITPLAPTGGSVNGWPWLWPWGCSGCPCCSIAAARRSGAHVSPWELDALVEGPRLDVLVEEPTLPLPLPPLEYDPLEPPLLAVAFDEWDFLWPFLRFEEGWSVNEDDTSSMRFACVSAGKKGGGW